MALEPLAIEPDVVAVYGELSGPESALIDGRLDQASTALRVLVADVDQRVARSELAAKAATKAVVNAVVRVMKNPDGARQRQHSETDGPFTESSSTTIDTALSSGEIYISAKDLKGLVPGRGSFRTIRAKPGLR